MLNARKCSILILGVASVLAAGCVEMAPIGPSGFAPASGSSSALRSAPVAPPRYAIVTSRTAGGAAPVRDERPAGAGEQATAFPDDPPVIEIVSYSAWSSVDVSRVDDDRADVSWTDWRDIAAPVSLRAADFDESVEIAILARSADLEPETSWGPVAAPEQSAELYEVRPGDTLYAIALRAYGDASRYTDIYAANRQLLESPDRIFVGQRLELPAI